MGLPILEQDYHSAKLHILLKIPVRKPHIFRSAKGEVHHLSTLCPTKEDNDQKLAVEGLLELLVGICPTVGKKQIINLFC